MKTALFKPVYWPIWMTYSLIWGSCAVVARNLNPNVIGQLAGGSLGVVMIIGVILSSRHWLAAGTPAPRRLNWRGDRLFTGLTLAAVAFTLTSSAISNLPPPLVIQSQANLVELGRFYWLSYYAALAFIIVGVLEAFWPASLAEIGLTVIVVYGTLNGGLFNVLETSATPVFYSLTLVTILAYRLEPPPAPAPNPLRWPTAALVVAGGLSTWQALYPHNSLVRWLALVNWVVVFWLLVAVIRRQAQVNRLLAALFCMAALVTGAAVTTFAEIAAAAGGFRVWGLRTATGYMAPNGVGIFAITFLTLALGFLLIWRKWWQRALLLTLSGWLLGLLLLSYSRTSAVGLGVGLGALVWGWAYLRRKTDNPASSWDAPGDRLGRATLFAALGGIGLLVAGLVIFSFWGRNASTSARILTTLGFRTYLWQIALNSIGHYPVLGVGLNNNFNPIFYNVLSVASLQPVRALIVNNTHTHNLLLEIGVSLGAVGFTVIIWLGVTASRLAWQTINHGDLAWSQRWLAVIVCAAGAAWLSGHSLVMVLSERSLIADSGWLLLALLVIAGQKQLQATEPAPHLPQPARPPALVTGLVLLAALLLVVRPLLASDLRRQAQTALAAGDQPAVARLMALEFWLQPLDAEARAWYGQASRNSAVAIPLYEQALALRPYHAPYVEKLGWLHWRQNNLPAAQAAFKRAGELDGYDGTGPYHASLGYTYAAAGQTEAAITALQTALTNRSNFIQSPDWQVIGDDLVLAPAYTTPPAQPLTALIDSHLGWGNAAASAGPSAITLDQTLTPLLATEDKTWLLSVITAYTRQGLFDRAESLLRHFQQDGAATAKQHAQVQALLAFNRGDMAAAQTAFEAFGQTGPPSSHFYLGMIYKNQGQLAAALAEFEQLLQLRLATVYLSTTEWSQVGAAFQQAGQLEPAREAYQLAQFRGGAGVEYAQAQLALNQIYLAQQQPGPVLSGVRLSVAGLQAWPAGAVAPLLQQLAAQSAQAYQMLGVPAEVAQREQTQWLYPPTPLSEVYLDLLAQTLTQ